MKSPTKARRATTTYRRSLSSSADDDEPATDQSWSDEWRRLGLGARLPEPGSRITNLLFVQTGFGVDQHGDRKADGATKASVRAVRNAIEFNSIPGVIETIPGGRAEMLIQVKLGVPSVETDQQKYKKSHFHVTAQRPMIVDLNQVAKVFPYGRLLPIEVVVGGLSFPTGRIVSELGDEDDMAVCVAASVSIGYDNSSKPVVGKDCDTDTAQAASTTTHKTYDTRDGY